MHNSDVSRVFLGRPISAGDLGEGTVMPPTKSSGKNLGGGPRSKAPGNSKNLVLQNLFKNFLPNFEFQINLSVQSYAPLIREHPAYVQTTYHYV